MIPPSKRKTFSNLSIKDLSKPPSCHPSVPNPCVSRCKGWWWWCDGGSSIHIASRPFFWWWFVGRTCSRCFLFVTWILEFYCSITLSSVFRQFLVLGFDGFGDGAQIRRRFVLFSDLCVDSSWVVSATILTKWIIIPLSLICCCEVEFVLCSWLFCVSILRFLLLCFYELFRWAGGGSGLLHRCCSFILCFLLHITWMVMYGLEKGMWWVFKA